MSNKIQFSVLLVSALLISACGGGGGGLCSSSSTGDFYTRVSDVSGTEEAATAGIHAQFSDPYPVKFG